MNDLGVEERVEAALGQCYRLGPRPRKANGPAPAARFDNGDARR
jgi:hypothetical protein